MTVKLAGKVPKSKDLNGLDSIEDELRKDPGKVQALLVFVEVQKEVKRPNVGTLETVVEAVRVEPLGPPGELGDVVSAALLQHAEKRTGKTPLPIDTVQVVEQGSIDEDF
jgi:hypothetical protein